MPGQGQGIGNGLNPSKNRDFNKTLCSYYINGSDSYVNYGNTLNSIIEGSNKVFTIGLWFRRLGTGSEWIFSNWNSIGNNRSLLINFRATNELKIQFSSDGISTSGTWESTGTITDTNWHQLICVYNNGLVNVILDKLAYPGTSTTIPTTLYSGTANVELGSGNGGMNNFNGYLLQPFITSDVVTLSEAVKLYNKGEPRVPSEIIDNLEREWLITNDTYSDPNWTMVDNQGNGNGTSVDMIAVDRDCNENPY